MRPTVPAVSLLLALPMASALSAQTTRPVNDPVGKLNHELAAGEMELEGQGDWGYARSLMEHLDLYPDSQVLVLSKTSLQATLISPQKPRALYFNDDVMMGIVQDSGLLEFTSLDPTEGLLFYTLDQAAPVGDDDPAAGSPASVKDRGLVTEPRFVRRSDCGSCHGPVNQYAPGLIVATSFPAPTGTARHTADGIFQLTDHRTPFEERWGGFYVTGTHGEITHRGNAVAPDLEHPYVLDTADTGNITSLEDRFDVTKYLESTGDIVALMTLGHQTGMINLLNSVGAQFRASETFPLPEAELAAEVDRLVSYMLFVGEARLGSPIGGVSTFSETFPARGPFDSQGLSLRAFDLQTRLFQYPLSYMIYSARFDGLPQSARDQIYRRLYEVLTGSVTDGGYDGDDDELDAARRRDLLEILVDTKPGLPEYFTLAPQP
ncbi:MAG TPA: hypothetical protein QF572_14470 [Vicinamibacterales bacterium]|nr:hypothetical protein [Dehalococcoidia bacterium]HJN45373.1 hypothetical protein [Vicinamibacterales bacterium]